MLWNEDQSPRVKSERKPTLREKWESVYNGSHTDNVSKETHVVSVMLVREGKDDRLLPHPIRRQSRLTARDENPHRDQAVNRKTRKTRVKFHADPSSVKIRHVSPGILLCVKSTSLKQECSVATNAISDMLRQR